MPTDHRSAWYRFSVKSVLMSMALVGLGATLLIWSARISQPIRTPDGIVLISISGWIVGGGFVGSGLLYPFGKAGWGALIGGLFQLAMIILAFVLAVMDA